MNDLLVCELFEEEKGREEDDGGGGGGNRESGADAPVFMRWRSSWRRAVRAVRLACHGALDERGGIIE